MNKISIKNMDGTMEEVDLVNAFKINDLNKRFVILSKGETAGEGMSKIYIWSSLIPIKLYTPGSFSTNSEI